MIAWQKTGLDSGLDSGKLRWENVALILDSVEAGDIWMGVEEHLYDFKYPLISTRWVFCFQG